MELLPSSSRVKKVMEWKGGKFVFSEEDERILK